MDRVDLVERLKRRLSASQRLALFEKAIREGSMSINDVRAAEDIPIVIINHGTPRPTA